MKEEKLEEKMYRVHVAFECCCFEKSEFENDLMYENKDDALMKAKIMECRMNQEFCQTYYFEAKDMGDEIIIGSVVRADYEDEDEDDF